MHWTKQSECIEQSKVNSLKEIVLLQQALWEPRPWLWVSVEMHSGKVSSSNMRELIMVNKATWLLKFISWKVQIVK